MTPENLFIIGPQRAGTTWLYELFCAQSKGVFLDRIEKENYFFSKTSGPFGDTQKEAFLKKLSGTGTPELYVDVVSTYFGHPEVIQKMATLFPSAKFLCIHRDEAARKKSFTEHREFNKFASKVLGYHISWELYEQQAKFDSNLESLQSIVSPGRVLCLEFADLVSSGGAKWSEQLNDFLDFEVQHVDLGQVNKSRDGSSLAKRMFYGGARFVQATRIHILVKKVTRWLQKSKSVTE